jgi:hypothetical protein
MPFHTYRGFKTIQLLTNLTNLRVLRKFVFRQIFPLFLQFIVLFEIGFTKELIYTLFYSLYISENKSINLFHKQPSLLVSSDNIKDVDDENTNTNTDNKYHEGDSCPADNIKNIDNENTNTNMDEVDIYPEGDSCPVCKKVYDTTLFWCTVCDSKRRQDDFPNWTSGNQEFDQCIRNAQLKADGHTNYIEWIPYDKFTDIKKIGEGGFGIVYSATWAEGPKWRWDNEKMQWVGSGPRKVALKTLKHPMNEKLLKEVRIKKNYYYSFFFKKKKSFFFNLRKFLFIVSLSVILLALV